MKTNCANCRYSGPVFQVACINTTGDIKMDTVLCCRFNPPCVKVVSLHNDETYIFSVFPEVDASKVCGKHAIAAVFLDE